MLCDDVIVVNFSLAAPPVLRYRLGSVMHTCVLCTCILDNTFSQAHYLVHILWCKMLKYT